jgi:hypothetical protein
VRLGQRCQRAFSIFRTLDRFRGQGERAKTRPTAGQGAGAVNCETVLNLKTTRARAGRDLPQPRLLDASWPTGG